MNLYLDEYNSSLYSSGRTISHIRDLNDFFNDNSNNSDKISAPTMPLQSPSAVSERNVRCKSHDMLYSEQKSSTMRRMSAASSHRHDVPVQTILNKPTFEEPKTVAMPRPPDIRPPDHSMFHNYPGEVNLTVRSNSSIHSTYSDKSDELNSVDHISSEDNLSHDSYDLVDREEEDGDISGSVVGDNKFHAYDNMQPMCNVKIQTYQPEMKNENELKVVNYCSVHSSRVSSPQPSETTPFMEDGSGSLRSTKAKGSRRSSRHGMDSTYESKSSLVETVIEVKDTATNPKDHTLNKAMQLMLSSASRDVNKMHDIVVIRSPTHLKYFNQHFNREPKFKSRTLPRKMHVHDSKKHSHSNKQGGTPQSNSSSSNGSPKLFRPKSLDFLGVGLNNLTEKNNYFSTKYECEDSSSMISVPNDQNCSSSDAPQSPRNGLLSDHNRNLSYKGGSPADSQPWAFQEEKIYDIPEGIESAMENVIVHKCSFAPKPSKFSSEDSESFPNPPPATLLRKGPNIWMNKVSSTESESIPPPVLQVDSDTLSLPLDLLSPPMESESSTALVESESLPAPPQFDNKDDTDIDEESAKDNNTDDQLDENFEPIIQNRRKQSVLMHALDTFESFNMENDYTPCQLVKRQETTYEDKAESILEKQRTVGSFTVQDSVDDVFVIGPGVANALDMDSLHYRTALLESQSTFESVTTEREILVTKRQESTFEDKAEAMLESQNTIDSFTTEYQNESDVFSRNNSLDPTEMTTSFSNQGSFDGAVTARRGSLIKESPIDLNDGDFGLPGEQPEDKVDQFVTDCCNKPEHFHAPFMLQRTLSRISEKSSNYSDSSRSEEPPQPPNNPNTSVSEQEEEVDEINYTASDDNENAPSINSDIPENAATPTNDTQENLETIVPWSPDSNNVTPKETEFTNVDPDTLEDDLDDTNAEEIKTEERLSMSELDPDASISTENNISKRESDDESLHDSMELLENVKTADHFDDLAARRKPSDDLDSSSKLDPEEPDMFENSGKFVVTEGSAELMF